MSCIIGFGSEAREKGKLLTIDDIDNTDIHSEKGVYSKVHSNYSELSTAQPTCFITANTFTEEEEFSSSDN